MLRKLLIGYLVLTGIILHLAAVSFIHLYPQLTQRVYEQVLETYYQRSRQKELDNLADVSPLNVDAELASTFLPWQPSSTYPARAGIYVNGAPVANLAQAERALSHGARLDIGTGVYETPLTIRHNNVTITGHGHVIFQRNAARQKGFILAQGNNLSLVNIECRFISVSDRNGACVRLEGSGLNLEHVYFHSSEQGILETATSPGAVIIRDSRFEKLGKSGRAHGIYLGRADLLFENSLMLAAKDQGHGIKTRGKNTVISRSILMSLSSDDSRLLDISNGGQLLVEDSVLAQGPKSVNSQLIGFALEGQRFEQNRLQLKNNLILLDRVGTNVLLYFKDGSVSPEISGNIIVGKHIHRQLAGNTYFSRRSQAQLPLYPRLPFGVCNTISNCSLMTEP